MHATTFWLYYFTTAKLAFKTAQFVHNCTKEVSRVREMLQLLNDFKAVYYSLCQKALCLVLMSFSRLGHHVM